VTPPDNDTPLASRSAVSRNVTANTVEGDTKSFYVDVTGKTISAKLKETGTYCKIWVDVEFDNLDVSTLVTKFDAIYPVETNLVGFEYGGGPGGNGGVDGDPKVQILVYDIAGGGTLGYFYPGDEYQRGTTYPYSNEAEIFYLDSYLLAPNGMTTIYSTMIHEFNHMINFNVKVLQGGQIRVWNNETWYTEMLSMLAEDVIWPYLNNTPSPVIGMRIPGWRDRYYDYSVMYWPPKTAYTIPYYWSNYAFGAYLVRNFGGVPLFSAIAKSPAGGRASIDGSLRAFNSQNRAIDVTYALERFGETLVYFDNVPDNVYSFNKNTPPETITTHDGTSYNYSFTMFDIRHTSNPPSEPKVFPFNEMGQTPMPINTVQIFQDQSWKNITDGQLDIQFLGVDTGAKYFALIKKN
jgi:hypothetical protein